MLAPAAYALGTALRISGSIRSLGLLPGLFLAACATVEPPDGRAVSTRDARPAVEPAAPIFVRDEILGRDAPALDAMLGPAALIRREGEGEFRRYPLAACSLIVILYPDEKGVRSAGHIDAAARASGEDKPDLDLCLARGLSAPAG